MATKSVVITHRSFLKRPRTPIRFQRTTTIPSMKPNKHHPLAGFMATPLAVLILTHSAQADSSSWNLNNAGLWSLNTNWIGSSIPGATSGTTIPDIATFGNATLTADRVVTVDANRNIGGITFSNTTAFKYTLNGGNLLLTNNGVIQTSAGNGNHTDTISTAIEIEGDGGAATFTSGATSATSLLSIGAVTGVSTGTNVTILTLNGTNTGANLVTGVIGDGAGLGKLALIKDGAGSWTLSSNNTFSGGTTITAGTLQLGTGLTTGSLSPTGTITNNGNLTIKRSNAVVQGVDFSSAAIIGNGTLTQAGTGTLTFNALNSYSGLTTVSSGAIGGTGKITGAVTVSGTGGINLGDGQIGTFTLGSTLGITGAAGANKLFFDLASGGSTTDLITVADVTSVTTAGAAVVSLNQLGGAANRINTGTYTLIQGTGSMAASTQFALATTKAFGSTFSNLVASGTNLQVTATQVTAATPAAFWAGGTSVNWNTSTNWKTDATSNSAVAGVPDYQTNVTFHTTTPTATNLSTTVNADFDINSLNFSTAAISAVTVATGTKMLTIEATDANGNTAGNGITVNSPASGTPTQTISGKVGLASSQTWTVNTGAALTVSAVVSDFGGAYNLTKSGPGILTLSSANTYSGGTTIKAGTVALGNTVAAAGSGTITLGDTSGSNDATLSSGYNITYANPVSLGATTGIHTIRSSGTNSPSFNGDIALNGRDLTFKNDNTGTLKYSANASAISGNGNIILKNNSTGSLKLGDTGSVRAGANFTGTLTNNGAGTNTSYIYYGVGAGVSQIVQDSPSSSLVFYGGNAAFTGSYLVRNGTLISQNGTLGSSCQVILGDSSTGAGGAALGFNNYSIDSPITVSSSAGSNPLTLKNSSTSGYGFSGAITLDNNLTIDATGAYTSISGRITGSKDLTITSTAPNYVNLNNAGNSTSFTGNVLVKTGQLRVANAGSLGTANILTVASGALFDIASTNAIIAGLNDVVGGSGTVSKYSGLGVYSLTIGGSGSYSFSGVIANAVMLDTRLGLIIATTGGGSQTLSGANTYTGNTTISSGGILKLANAKALGYGGTVFNTSTGTTVAPGGTLDLNGTTDINETITLNGTGSGSNGALINNSASPASIGDGVASATVAVTGTGSGYSSPPTVTFGGTGSGATATAALGLTTASIDTITGGGTNWVVGDKVYITGGGASNATATVTSVSAGAITGLEVISPGAGYTSAPTGMAKLTSAAGGGTLTLTGNANNFAVGGLNMTAAGLGYTGTPTFEFGGGGGSGASVASVTLSSVVLASDSSIGGTGDITIKAVISETGGTRSLTKVGGATLTLAGSNTYTGNTTVENGTLVVNTPNFSDFATVTIGTVAASPAVLNLPNDGTDTVGGLVIDGVAMPNGLYDSTNTDNAITGNGKILVAANYDSWAFTHGVTGGPNGDSDNDGIPNLVEYALLLNFAGSDGAVGTFDGTTLTFTKRGEAVTNDDVIYQIETSPTLGAEPTPWTAVAATTDTPTEITYRLPHLLPKEFARLKVTRK